LRLLYRLLTRARAAAPSDTNAFELIAFAFIRRGRRNAALYTAGRILGERRPEKSF
jgi:hypothetical protein